MNVLLKFLLMLALLIVTVVIPLGAFTRLSDAGLGCPDWPTCYGYIDFRKSMDHVEQINAEQPGALREAHKTWPEMVHRYFASKLGLIMMLMAIGAFWLSRKGGDQDGVWGKLPIYLFFLVCFQGILGMWTVTMKLYPPTVVAHLYGGFLTFSLLVLLSARVFKLFKNNDSELARFRTLAFACLFVLLIQIGLGGWMSANYAAMVCTELPICEAGWAGKLTFAEAFSASYHASVDYEFGLLSHDARVTIHVLHRIFAMVVTAMLLWLIVSVFRSGANSQSKRVAALILVLLCVQVALGISNVVFHLPLSVATAHNGVGALLMAALMSFCYLTNASSKHS
jgi:cytochrome c oxidase assembly protein subunit 15